MALQVGDSVPSFTLHKAFGEVISSDKLFAAGPTAIHFWPFSFSGNAERGCEAQVCGFGSREEELKGRGIQLIGVSHDSPFVQALWQEKLGQDYPILSDHNLEAARAFGILEDEINGFSPLNLRAAFIVDRDGVVQYAEVRGLMELPSWTALSEAAKAL
jgi:glutaredoxin-dependent peroxiredoxin